MRAVTQSPAFSTTNYTGPSACNEAVDLNGRTSSMQNNLDFIRKDLALEKRRRKQSCHCGKQTGMMRMLVATLCSILMPS